VASSRSEPTTRGPSRRQPRKDDVLGLLLEGDTDDPARPLDDQETADRSVETGEDRVGESLADGGGGDGFEQGIGQGSHAACLSRRLRTAVETRWRAASGGAAEPSGDVLVLEVVDETQPKRRARRLRERRDERLEGARVVVVLDGHGGSSSTGSSRRRARWASRAAVVVTRYSQARR
jgi:hypothetical protein